MRRIQIVFMLTIIFISCLQNEKPGIQGNWIGVERQHFIAGAQDTIYDFLPLIFEIGPDTLKTSMLEYMASRFVTDSIRLYKYYLTDSSLVSILNDDTLKMKINFNDNDNFVLSDFESKLLFSRLKPKASASKKIDLTNKIFQVDYQYSDIDTIEFLNNSKFFIYGSGRPYLLNWGMTTFENYQILISNSMSIPPYIIDEKKNGVIELKQKPIGNPSAVLTQINIKNEAIGDLIFGKWTGYSTASDKELIFDFEEDSLLMNDCINSGNIKLNYTISISHKYILLPWNYEIRDFMIYKILDINEHEVILERMYHAKDKIYLKKQLP
jgi:hypothetical protein